jgi:subtilisin family serine protease
MLLKPDVTAPGQDIISAFPGNKYAKWSGTSMATPHVTGALALFTQQFPGKAPQIAKTALLLSSQRMTTTTYGFGTIDVLRLLTVTTTRQSANAAPKSLMRSPKASKAVVF